jgi:hypothetical protein
MQKKPSKRILIWLLPVIDVFALKRILSYYASLSTRVPLKHARYGVIERWAGYMPAGFALCWYAGFLMTFAIALVALVLVGPIELHFMRKGTWPWRFFRGKPRKVVTRIFLLEGYNAVGYFLLGAALGLLI